MASLAVLMGFLSILKSSVEACAAIVLSLLYCVEISHG